MPSEVFAQAVVLEPGYIHVFDLYCVHEARRSCRLVGKFDVVVFQAPVVLPEPLKGPHMDEPLLLKMRQQGFS